MTSLCFLASKKKEKRKVKLGKNIIKNFHLIFLIFMDEYGWYFCYLNIRTCIFGHGSDRESSTYEEISANESTLTSSSMIRVLYEYERGNMHI